MAIYQGDETKFAINITAEGFSMDRDDFDVEVESTLGGSLKGSKGGTGTDVIIFSETEEVTVPPAEEGGEPTVENVTTWYVIVDTSKELVPGGALNVIVTAYIRDDHANDGTRKQTAVKKLDNFVAR